MLRVTLLAMLLLGVSAFAADRSGEYVGTYSSTEGDAAGKLRIVIHKNAEGAWSCQVFFTPEGEEIATKPGPCSVANDKITTEFDAGVEDTTFHATLKGSAVDDQSFEGTYVTVGAGGNGSDQGKWKVALKH